MATRIATGVCSQGSLRVEMQIAENAAETDAEWSEK